MNVLLEGWAYRYKMLRDGSRQIIAYLLPEDICDPHVFVLEHMDHSIGLLSDALVGIIPKTAIMEVTEKSPAIARTLCWSALVDQAVLCHWLVNMGQRDAFDRIAHLFCELWVRASQVGLVAGGAFDLPLTQEQLGETVGLTAVHTNRVLQRMRDQGLITFVAKRLSILDMDAMRQQSGFDPHYLHLIRADANLGDGTWRP